MEAIRKWKAVCWVLCLALCISMIPASAIANENQPQAEQTIKPEDVTKQDVIKSELGKDQTSYDLGGGDTMTVYHGGDVRYKDADGKLTDYNPSLTAIKDNAQSEQKESLNDYAYENKAGDKKQYLPKVLSEETPVLMEYKEYQISFAPTQKSLQRAGVDAESLKVEKEKVPTIYEEEKERPIHAVYGTSGGGNFKYTSAENGVKETLTLDQKPENNMFQSTLKLKGLTIKKNQEDEGFTFYDEKTKDIAGGISAPWMDDASGEAYSEKITYDLTKQEGREDTYLLTMTIDQAYLDDPERKWPVTVDPTVTWSGASDFWDAYVASGSAYANTNYYTSGATSLLAGTGTNGVYRTYLNFSGITSTATGRRIDSAKLTLYELSTSNSGRTIGAHKVSASWDKAALTWNNKPAFTAAAISSITTTGTANKAYTLDVLSYVRGIASGGTNYGLMLKSTSESASYGRFYGTRHATTAYKPKLTVVYTAAPSVASTVSASPQYMTGSTAVKVTWAGIVSKTLQKVQYRVAKCDDAGTIIDENFVPYSTLKTTTASSGAVSIAASKNWAAGRYRIYVRGVDTSGAVGTGKGVTVYMDKTAPTFPTASLTPASTQSAPGSTRSPKLTWSGIVEKYPKQVEYSVDDGAYVKAGTGLSGSADLAAITETGSHTIKARTIDQAGHVSAEKTFAYYIDGEAPTIGSLKLETTDMEGDSLGESWTKDGNPLVSFGNITEGETGIAAADMRYALMEEGKAPAASDYKVPSSLQMQANSSPYEGTFRLTAEDRDKPAGAYQLYFRTQDGMGNTSEKSVPYKKDAQAPSGNIKIYAQGTGEETTALKDTPTIAALLNDGKGSGIQSSSLKLYKIPSGGGTLTEDDIAATIIQNFTADTNRAFNTTSYPNGDYLLHIDAEDMAGNLLSETKPVTIENPIAAPKLIKEETGNQITVSWNYQTKPETLEEMQYKVGEDGSWTAIANSNAASGSFLLPQANLPEEYTVKVRGVDDQEVGGKEAVLSGIYDAPPPVAQLDEFERGSLTGTVKDKYLTSWTVKVKAQDAPDADYETILTGTEAKTEEELGFIDLTETRYEAGQTYILKLEAEDASQNVSSDTLQITKSTDGSDARIIEPLFRIKRPDGQSYGGSEISLARTTTALELVTSSLSPLTDTDMKWYIAGQPVGTGATYADDFSGLPQGPVQAKYTAEQNYPVTAVKEEIVYPEEPEPDPEDPDPEEPTSEEPTSEEPGTDDPDPGTGGGYSPGENVIVNAYVGPLGDWAHIVNRGEATRIDFPDNIVSFRIVSEDNTQNGLEELGFVFGETYTAADFGYDPYLETILIDGIFEEPSLILEMDAYQEDPDPEEPTSEEPTSEEPTSEEPTSEEPTSEEPGTDDPDPGTGGGNNQGSTVIVNAYVGPLGDWAHLVNRGETTRIDFPDNIVSFRIVSEDNNQGGFFTWEGSEIVFGETYTAADFGYDEYLESIHIDGDIVEPSLTLEMDAYQEELEPVSPLSLPGNTNMRQSFSALSGAPAITGSTVRHYSSPVIQNKYVGALEEWGRYHRGDLVYIGFPKNAVSFRVFGNLLMGGQALEEGKTYQIADFEQDGLFLDTLWVDESQSAQDITIQIDVLEEETFHISDLAAYGPSNLTVQGKINYKTYLNWESAETGELAERISYEVHRGTEANFTPSEETLVAKDIKDRYFTELNTDYGGTFYYKVRAVKKNSQGKVTQETAFSNEVSGTVVDADEFTKRMGMKDYWQYAEMALPIGTGYVEKSQGNFLYEQTDAQLPNEAMAVDLTRTYNSQSTAKTAFGVGWTHSFDLELLSTYNEDDPLAPEKMVFKDASGTLFTFVADGTKPGSYISSMSKFMSLQRETKSEEIQIPDKTAGSSQTQTMKTVTVASEFTLKTKDKLEYRFNSGGQLVYQTDTNGNFLLFEHDQETGLLSKVITNRNIAMEFVYNDGTGGTDPLTVKEVLLPDGSKRQYAYTGSGTDLRLASMTQTSSEAGNNQTITYELGYTLGVLGSKKLNEVMDGKGNAYDIEYDGEKAQDLYYPGNESIELSYLEDGKKTITKQYIGSQVFSTEENIFNTDSGACVKYTDTAGAVSTYTYLDDLLQTTTRQVDYQSLNQETGVVSHHQSTRTETSTYNTGGDATTETDEQGGITTSQYTESTNWAEDGQVSSMEERDANGDLVSDEEYEYDEDGNEISSFDSVTDTETETEYNEDGEVTQEQEFVEDVLISTTTYQYTYGEDGSKTVAETVTTGTSVITTTTAYDSMGRELTVKETEGTADTANASVLSLTTSTYDGFGRLIQTSRKDGEMEPLVTSSTYDANGTLTSETDPEGLVTSYVYDNRNRQVSRTLTKGNTERTWQTAYSTAEVSPLGSRNSQQIKTRLTTETNPDGDITAQTYQDATGQTIREKANGLYTDYTYNRQGSALSTCEGSEEGNTQGLMSLSLYDAAGNQTHTIQNPTVANGSYQMDEDSILTSQEYDVRGNMTDSIDGEGNRTSFTYDIENQLTKVETPDGQETNYAYDKTDAAGDSHITTTDAKGQKSIVTSNVRGQTTQTADIGAGATPNPKAIKKTFTYHETKDNVLKEQDEEGNYRAFIYDDKDRLLTTKYFEKQNGQNVQTLETRYTYDLSDNITSMKDYAVEEEEPVLTRHTAYEYDYLKRLTGFAEVNGPDAPTQAQIQDAMITYTYDIEGNLMEIDYPNTGNQVQGLTFSYESGTKRLEGISAKLAGGEEDLRDYSYDAFGNVEEIKDYRSFLTGNKSIYTQKTYAYDSFHRLTDITYADSSDPSEEKEVYGYRYDKNGNITREAIKNSYPAAEEDKTDVVKDYTYSVMGQLTKTEIADQITGGETTNTYSFDAVGNRVSQSEGDVLSTYTYNDLNQLTRKQEADEEGAVSDISYVYDKNGNQIETTDSITGTVEELRYDADNRLSQYQRSKDDVIAFSQQQTYNGEGQRIQKVAEEQVTNYYYQGDTVLYTTNEGQVDEQGSPVETKTTSLNLMGEGGSVIATARPGTSVTSDSYYFYHKDTRGSTSNLLDASGESAVSYQYGDFGETTIQGDDPIDNEICYTGGIYDAGTGQYYLNARYYDPEDGRFLTQDTYRGEQEAPGTWHLYAYCSNDPINFTDPTGHWGWDIHKTITNDGAQDVKSNKAIKKLTLKELKKASIIPDQYRNLYKDNKKKYKKYKKFKEYMYHGKSPELYEVRSNRIAKAAKYYKKRKYEKAIWHLGVALHTVQDYWAHSISWKKRKGLTIIFFTDYRLKKGETHENTFDNVKRKFDSKKHIWRAVSEKDNPRLANARSSTDRLLRDFLKKV